MDPFEQFLLEAGDAAFAVDPRRRVVYWNSACEDLLGVPARAALGQPCCDLVRAVDASGGRYCGSCCSPGKLAKGGAALKPAQLWFEGKKGSRLPLWLSVFLVPSQWQELWTVMHVLQRKPHALVRTLPCSQAGIRSREKTAETETLTPREREILALLAHGHGVSEISHRLCLSPLTVRNHVQHVIGKLGLHSQLEAVAYAYRNNLV